MGAPGSVGAPGKCLFLGDLRGKDGASGRNWGTCGDLCFAEL